MEAAQAISTPRLFLALLIRTVLVVAIFVASAVIEMMITDDFPRICGRVFVEPEVADTVNLTAMQLVLGTLPAVAAVFAIYVACRVPLMSWRSTQAVSIVWASVVGLPILFLGFNSPLAVC